MLLHHILEQSAETFPNEVALICQNQKLTYTDLENFANRTANALVSKGLEKQDRAAIYLENSVESVISVFGILKAGGVFLAINPQVKAKKLEYILNDCQVKVLITDIKHFQEALNVLNNCPCLKLVLITDRNERNQFELHNQSAKFETALFYDIFSKASSTRLPKNCIDIDLASLIYTSGSTGNPKGVMLTHLNMISAANSITEYLENANKDIILNCLPMSFDYGLYQVLMAIKFGGKVVLERSFLYPYQIINLLVEEKVTGFPVVPAILAILLQLKNLDKINLSNLRYITNTAQALAPKHIAQFRQLFPHVKFYSMYGLTECKRVSYLPPEDIDRKPSSVGKAMPNTETYIVDQNGQRITKPGEIGELVVRGANVMKGYWNLPEETARKLRPGPYPGEMVLYTGDLFKLDEEGYLYFVSRKDDMIKTAGEMVSPKEVENALYEIENVIEAVVIGVYDEILGQAIKAFVVFKDGFRITEKEIIMHCSRKLENFKVPKNVEILQELPKTSSGKTLKKDLK